MVDVHTPEQRRKNMSAIKRKNTKPEVQLRKLLWAEGLRYRVKNNLPGKPDIVFPAEKIVIFIDGCFWHRCPQHFINPVTRAEFWDKKISGNVKRDNHINEILRADGWQVLRFWEHEIKKNCKNTVWVILKKIESARKVM